MSMPPLSLLPTIEQLFDKQLTASLTPDFEEADFPHRSRLFSVHL